MHDHNSHNGHGHIHDHNSKYDKPISNSKNTKSDKEKLKLLMNYWIDHNNEHMNENENWLIKIEKMGIKSVASELKQVNRLLKEITLHIKSAKSKLDES